MDLYSIRPTPAMLDNLIRCFAYDGSLDMALLYLDEMSRFRASSPWLSRRSLAMLLNRCYKDKDARAHKVASEARKRGMVLGEDALSKLSEIGGAKDPIPEATEP